MTTNVPEPADLLDSDELTTLEVRLQMEFPAGGPIDAIDRYVDEVAHRGFDDFTYHVRDPETDESWVVQQGQVYTVEDYLALVGEQAAGDTQTG